MLKKSASFVLASKDPQRSPEATPQVFNRCGLAWGKARLADQGGRVRSLDFLSILLRGGSFFPDVCHRRLTLLKRF